ncbi:hypothetical protein ACFU5Y_06000 [Streptomyces gardneri]|uniref:hypothetical protein n=1 Tax=Streptomyces gardneri TaxID=66892 RepID=UPI0036AF5321
MTAIDRTAPASLKSQRHLTWGMIAVGLVSIAAVVVLGVTGNPEAATAAALVGAAVFTAGGITITINVRR